MFDELFPILSTPDLAQSLHFYRYLLSGTVTYRFGPSAPEQPPHGAGSPIHMTRSQGTAP